MNGLALFVWSVLLVFLGMALWHCLYDGSSAIGELWGKKGTGDDEPL